MADKEKKLENNKVNSEYVDFYSCDEMRIYLFKKP